ncbi:Nn.00g117980.m01.CDS01 [Neocucurbitaria sp. VM-36]
MAPLTYARLLTRLRALYDSVPEQIKGPGDSQRIRELQSAINAGIVAAQAGLGGSNDVPNPRRLKYDITTTIDEINERYEREAAVSPSSSLAAVAKVDEESESETDDTNAQLTRDLHDVLEAQETRQFQRSSPQSGSGKENPTAIAAATTRQHPVTKPAITKKTPTVTKRLIRNPAATSNSGVKKSVSKRTTRQSSRNTSATKLAAVANTIEDHEAAAALLGLSTSVPVTYNHSHLTPPSCGPYVPHNINITPSNVSNDIKGKQRAPFATPMSPLNFPNKPFSEIHPNPYRFTHSGTEFLDIPATAVDLARFDKEIFLAGVKFAMQNFTAAHAIPRCGNHDDEFAERCYKYVRYELIAKEQVTKEAAKKAVKEAINNDGDDSTVGKKFWDVI